MSRCKPALDTKPVCLKAYCHILGLSAATVRKTERRVRRGHSQPAVGRPRSRAGTEVSSSENGEHASAWISAYLLSIAENQPTGSDMDYHMNFIDEGTMYDEYVEHVEATSIRQTPEIISERSFLRVLRGVISKLKIGIRRKANASTKCDGEFPISFPFHSEVMFFSATTSECESLRLEMLSARNNAARETVQAKRQIHTAHIRQLRELYRNAVARAEHCNEFQTVTFDGSDTATCLVPQAWRSNLHKDISEDSQLAQKIQTVLIHGKVLNMYIVPPYIETGAALTISTLLHSLLHVDPRVEIVRFQFDGERPLCLSVSHSWDNIDAFPFTPTGGSENMNQYTHVLFGILIHTGVFTEIQANRLPVG